MTYWMKPSVWNAVGTRYERGYRGHSLWTNEPGQGAQTMRVPALTPTDARAWVRAFARASPRPWAAGVGLLGKDNAARTYSHAADSVSGIITLGGSYADLDFGGFQGNLTVNGTPGVHARRLDLPK